VYGGARPRPRAYNTATEFRDASKGTRAPSHGARGDPLWQSSFGYVAFLLRRDRLRKARQKSWNMQGVARNHFRRARARRCMRPRRWTKHSGHLYIACGEGGFPGGRRSHFPAGFLAVCGWEGNGTKPNVVWTVDCAPKLSQSQAAVQACLHRILEGGRKGRSIPAFRAPRSRSCVNSEPPYGECRVVKIAQHIGTLYLVTSPTVLKADEPRVRTGNRRD
jgi:hypothetical protein